MMVLDRGKDCAMEQKQAIEQRISRRSFLQTPIEQQILRQLLEAIEEVNETSGLTVSYLEDGSDAFAGFKSYGMFDGVRAMLVLKGNRELAFLKEKVGYYGEQLILKARPSWAWAAAGSEGPSTGAPLSLNRHRRKRLFVWYRLEKLPRAAARSG